MQILFDSCLALLASIGIWTLGKMLFEYLFGLVDEQGNVIKIRICSDCTDFYRPLWNDVDSFDEFHVFDICWHEDGLSGLKTEQLDGILCVKLKEAEKWTRKENIIK